MAQNCEANTIIWVRAIVDQQVPIKNILKSIAMDLRELNQIFILPMPLL
jgi:hypothetical protein